MTSHPALPERRSPFVAVAIVQVLGAVRAPGDAKR